MGDEMAFNQVEWQPCEGCNAPLSSQFYTLGTKKVCPVCRNGLVAASTAQAGTFFAALGLGAAAAVAGALVYWLVRVQFHIELGLVAIGVGYVVGAAVRRGSRGVGGRGFQIMAVILTYLAITMQYVPDVVSAMHPEGVAWLFAGPLIFGLALAAPFLGGLSNLIGIVILGVGLWEAWKLTASSASSLKGPFSVGT